MKRLLLWWTVAAATALYLTPILVMLAGSFKSNSRVLLEAGTWRAFLPDQGWQNYANVLRRVEFWHLLGNSLIVTGSIVVSGLVVNSSAAYALARLRFRGREPLLVLVLALMTVPFETIAVPLFYQVSLAGWRDTLMVQILPFVGNAFSIYLFYSFFLALPPELEEAAALDGASPWQVFRFLAVPNSAPAYATVSVITFVGAWASYLWPLMVTAGEGVRPLSLAVAAFHTLPPLLWGDVLAFGVMMVTPVVLMFALLQRWFVPTASFSGIKG